MSSLPSPPRMNDPLTAPKWCPRWSSPSPRSAVTMRGPLAKHVTSVALTWRHPEPAVSGEALLLRRPTWLFWVPLVTTRFAATPIGQGGRRRLGGGLAVWQLPARPREVAVVAVRVALQVILVLGLGHPERDGRADLGHRLAGPQARGVDVGDRVLGDLALLLARVEDLRAVAGADVVALAILRRRVVDLEEELEDVPVGDALGVEDDLDRLGMTGMVPVGRVL